MAGDKNKLTEKQRQILEYLKQEILQRGFPPSVREICEAVSLRSTSSVHAHLETLERKGYIKRDATNREPLKSAMKDSIPAAWCNPGNCIGRHRIPERGCTDSADRQSSCRRTDSCGREY